MSILIGSVMGIIILSSIFNLIAIFWNPYPETYISRNQIRGMAIQHQGILYTLNFSQQNEVAIILNQSIPISQEETDRKHMFSGSAVFEKLIIYHFNGSSIELIPKGILESSYVFSISEWDKNNFFMEQSHGRLQDVLFTIF